MNILYGVSFSGTALAFLKGQLRHFHELGHKTALVAPDNDGADVMKMCKEESATFFEVPLQRQPNLWSDVKALFGVFRAVKSFSPDMVIAGTPKASLLVLSVSFLRRVRYRVYLCHGLRFEGFSGWKRVVATAVERTFCALATDIVAVSDSVKRGLIEIGVESSDISVLGHGSPNGIDLTRFNRAGEQERDSLRYALNILNPNGELLFVGRVTHDKGLRYLRELATAMPRTSLTLIGPIEISRKSDTVDLEALTQLQNVRLLGAVANVEEYMKAADVLLLPTLREGLPTVILEAAACGLPVVAMEATGTVDAVASCEAGLLTPQGDTPLFLHAVRDLLQSESKRSEIAARSATLAASRFGQEVIWSNWELYVESIGDSQHQPKCFLRRLHGAKVRSPHDSA